MRKLAFVFALLAFAALAFAQNGQSGQQIFNQQGCSGCHGANGGGGIGPKLAGNKDLSNAQHVIHQIINGGGGMPPFGNKLSDQQIATVASYVRSSWGNSFGKITAAQVKQQKGGGQAGGGQQSGSQQQSGGQSGGAKQSGGGQSGGKQQGQQSGGAASGGASGGVNSLTFKATLNGKNESPPTNSKATGKATATLKGHKLTVHGSFQGLSSSLFKVEGTPAHIHQAPAGLSGPIVFKLVVQPGGMSGGASGGQATRGTFKGTFTLTDAQILVLKAANFYINVHTKNNPNGEIRGQLLASTGSTSGGGQSGGQQFGGASGGVSGGQSGGMAAFGGAASGGQSGGNQQSGGQQSGGQFGGQQSGGQSGGGQSGGKQQGQQSGGAVLGGQSGGVISAGAKSGGAPGGLVFTATLRGAYEVPPTNSKATGKATATLKGHTLTVHGSFQGLSSSLFKVEGTPAHIHQAPAGVSGPIAFKLTVQAGSMSGGVMSGGQQSGGANQSGGQQPGGASGGASGGQSGGGQSKGTFKGTFTLTDAQVLALKVANFYINVHTKNHPEGAIRGQLIVGRGSVSGGGQSGGAVSGGAMKPSNPGHPNQQELNNADQDTDWLMYNKGYSGLRYSSLKKINTSNVGNLQPVCSIKVGGSAGFSSFEATPQEYNGVMYVTTAHDTFAIDPTTCKKKWEYDYKPVGPETQPIDRGVALYNGMVFRGTTDAHIIALDMATGKLLWNIQPKGIDPAKGYFFSSVPVVYDGLLLIGTAGGDWGAPAVMFALNPANGKVVWRFSEIKADTFGKHSADTGAGSNWSSYTVDTKTGLVYIPVGNPGPDFAPNYRPGKNLYTDSVIVLDAKTGKLDHYYQQIPNDFHDWDTAPQPSLFELNGKKYLAVGSKDGYVYVYNDDSQKLAYKVAVTRHKNDDAPLTSAGTTACPSSNGGMQWYGPIFDPQTGYIYTNSSDQCAVWKKGTVHYVQGQAFTGTTNAFGTTVGDSYGWTTAIDASTGKIAWKRKSDTGMQSSVTPTAGGIVFTGDLNGHFLALNAKTGKVLYNFNVGKDIAGGISTFEVGGTQYVAVTAGSLSRSVHKGGGTPTVYVFSLKSK